MSEDIFGLDPGDWSEEAEYVPRLVCCPGCRIINAPQRWEPKFCDMDRERGEEHCVAVASEVSIPLMSRCGCCSAAMRLRVIVGAFDFGAHFAEEGERRRARRAQQARDSRARGK